ncbi:DHA1 family inner membrane transport protein [Kitasatospora gansuensis]|uniref:DHA1 family inner membrane transport protein n=1 Tax=Kitasatospora gansuensis TaxID=258050 RepID=A0A7W7S7D6_9ACTN|nr:MFS transporter [Kitasatospora gansuensis]MBB4945260.1 DHA1 family inner membrane transport protein [Kitasatospora gansuensis]
MSTQQTALSPGRANLALATLFLGMFVLGSGELLVVGVLDRIAADLHVTIPEAGTLVTVYALGLAIGGPILTALTIKLEKKSVLIGSVALFIACNLVAVLTSNYGLFLVLRFLIGASQGLFIAGAFMAAMVVVPPERIGQAIGIVISGVAMSGALGVPLGTLVGQTLGWRGSFTAIVVGAVITLIGTATLIPTVPPAGAGAAHQAKYAFAPRVLAVLFLNFIVFSTVFATLTYLVPFLQRVTGISGGLLSVFLLAYGAATAIGSFGGGKFADRNASLTLIIGSVGIAVSLLVLYFVGSIAWLVVLALLAWGLSFYSIVPSLQVRVISLAGPGGQLAQSLPVSAANIGIALGAFAGGVAIDNYSASAPVIMGLIFSVVTIAVAWGSSYLKPPVVDEESSPAAAAPAALAEPA